MPRGGKKNANQHNNRHENGVVAPGKRIARQKSNGHLNGNSEGRSGEDTPPVPTATGTSTQPAQSHANDSAAHATRSPVSKQERVKTLTLDVSDASPKIEAGLAAADKMVEQTHRRIDLSAVRPALSNDGGMIPLAMTVLASCPLRDTLAILIFLLSLPPTVATITNSMFALLTFVPPSGSFAVMFTMWPSLTDITSSFSPGTPSLIVTVLIDVVAMWLWVWLPKAAQALALDAAQAMVATTLGGGYNYKPGANDNTLLCVLIVACTHLARYRPLLLKHLHRTYIGRWAPIWDEFDESYVDRQYPVGTRNWWATVKVIIALHIVCQGFTRSVRRMLHSSRTAASQPPAFANKPTDPEASLEYLPGSEMLETAQNLPHSPTELKSRSSLQNMKETRQKESKGKRRRKQANFVRSQQPFWAAFAATKATIVREYELSRANADAVTANATDIRNFGNAPFATSENRIWVTAIRETSFFFETSSLAPNRCYSEGDEDVEDESGIDRSKPLYVCCNGMKWSAVDSEAVPNTSDEYKKSQWAGEVSMLSPGKTYHVSFLRCEDDLLLHSETIATLSALVHEQTSATPTATNVKHPRPSSPASPIATLKHSIANFEANVKDLTEQLRLDKKDNRAAANALRREIEILTDKMHRYSTTDKNLKNRQGQQNQQMRQAEDAIVSLTQELESYTDIPEEETVAWKERREALEVARAEMSSAGDQTRHTKEGNHSAYRDRQSEELNTKHKRERMQSRLERLSKQHKRLLSPEEDDSGTSKSRSNSDPSVRAPGSDRLRVEEGYRKQIETLMQNVPAVNNQIQLCRSQINALEFAAQQQALEIQAQEQAAAMQVESRPVTPEGDLPGTNPPSSVNRYNNAFGTPDSGYIPMANGRSHSGNGFGRSDSIRARSASGMSGEWNYRDYKDFDDDDAIPFKAKRRSGIDNIREGSDGSGSGSGSGGGSPSVRYRGKSSPSPGLK
ncbi:MAG: hypothetical protein MMC23_000960 [Stictis urceolatum]|nr:hypothetical protein [Stictis urceolata]